MGRSEVNVYGIHEESFEKLSGTGPAVLPDRRNKRQVHMNLPWVMRRCDQRDKDNSTRTPLTPADDGKFYKRREGTRHEASSASSEQPNCRAFTAALA